MADTIITILGTSGAGKTCYLLSMYHKMCSGMKGFTITADDDTDVELRHRYQQMTDRSLGNRRFPAGTDARSQYEFTLECGYEPVMSFSWDDYPGGYLDEKNTGDMDAYNQVEQSILNSSCLFICVDGTLLQGDDIEDKKTNLQEDCSIIINPFFSKYKKAHGTLPPTAFVITKWDVCAADNSPEDLKEIIHEAFSPFFEAGETGKTIAAIIPVSIDIDSDSTEPGKRMRPYNIQLPIFMGIFFALRKRISDWKRRKTSLQGQISEERSGFWHWFFGDSDSVRQLDADVKDLQKDLNINRDKLKKLFLQLEECVPLFFINGHQGRFSDIDSEKRDTHD